MILSISVYIIGLVTNNAGYEAFPSVALVIISGFTIILWAYRFGQPYNVEGNMINDQIKRKKKEIKCHKKIVGE
jgi:hypothetical protein